jgi:hypothetical protein
MIEMEDIWNVELLFRTDAAGSPDFISFGPCKSFKSYTNRDVHKVYNRGQKYVVLPLFMYVEMFKQMCQKMLTGTLANENFGSTY